jgi:hypothetical protein
MKKVIEHLLRAQPLLRRGNWGDVEQQGILSSLRKRIPEEILAHYLRALESDRNGVALVRHGVCGECHIHVPAATLANLFDYKDVHLCENCGCYLMLSPDEGPVIARSTKPVPAVVRRRRAHPVAVAA